MYVKPSGISQALHKALQRRNAMQECHAEKNKSGGYLTPLSSTLVFYSMAKLLFLLDN